MTKKIIVIILLVVIVFLLCGCNDLLEKTTHNTKAYIKINEKIIVVDVDAYTTGSNGIVTVRGIDGKTYRTHLMNVVIVIDVERR